MFVATLENHSNEGNFVSIHETLQEYSMWDQMGYLSMAHSRFFVCYFSEKVIHTFLIFLGNALFY